MANESHGIIIAGDYSGPELPKEDAARLAKDLVAKLKHVKHKPSIGYAKFAESAEGVLGPRNPR